MIKVEKLAKNEVRDGKSREILKELTFQVSQGEFIAILGPAKSGKTTLLTLLGGLDIPSRGTCHVGEKDLTTLEDAERTLFRRHQIGFIFQDLHLVENYDLLRNTALPLACEDGSANTQSQTRQALELVGLAALQHEHPVGLTRGEQQRAAIARAMVHNPPLLLTDEPAGKLDPRSRLEVLAILQHLHRNSKTIVMMTRDPETARHANRILRLQDGRIASDQTVSQPPDATTELSAWDQAQAAARAFAGNVASPRLAFPAAIQ